VAVEPARGLVLEQAVRVRAESTAGRRHGAGGARWRGLERAVPHHAVRLIGRAVRGPPANANVPSTHNACASGCLASGLVLERAVVIRAGGAVAANAARQEPALRRTEHGASGAAVAMGVWGQGLARCSDGTPLHRTQIIATSPSRAAASVIPI
jgi:hypothetical protein